MRLELHKHTLNLRNGDWLRLGEIHPDIETSRVIRQLIAAYVDKNDPPPSTETVTQLKSELKDEL